MTQMTKATLEAIAKATLPIMDVPEMFDEPVPACVSDAHDWSIVHDKQVTEAYSRGSDTYPVAIVCAHCDYVVGFRG